MASTTCSLLITCLPDGTFHVKETEPAGSDPSDQPVDQSFQSPDEVLQVVQQFLSEGQQGGDSGPDSQMPDDGSDDAPSAPAWNKEAATRGPSGFKN